MARSACGCRYRCLSRAVSGEARPVDRRVPAGRRLRYARAHPLTEVLRSARTDDRHRQPSRRRREHRRGDRVESRARRLHDPHGQHRARDQHEPVREARIRRRARLHRGEHAHLHRERRRRASFGSGEDAEGADRARQGQTRTAQHGLLRRRQTAIRCA